MNFQSFIARVNEIARLMPRSRRVDWKSMLLAALDDMSEYYALDQAALEVNIRLAIDHVKRQTGIDLSVPF